MMPARILSCLMPGALYLVRLPGGARRLWWTGCAVPSREVARLALVACRGKVGV